MNQNEVKIEQAAEDLLAVRRAVSHSSPVSKAAAPTDTAPTTGAHIILHSMALLLGVSGLLVELFSDNRNTGMFLSSAWNPEVQTVGLINLAGILAVLVGAIYAIVFLAAKRSGRSFKQYIKRHFPYLKDMSFVSDLVLKFCIIAMVILVNKPELVAPISLLFLGDYLIQGRFFTIRFELSNLFGYVFICVGIAMFFMGSSLLILPFVAVILSAAFSLWQMIRIRSANEKLNRKVAG